MRKPVFAYAKTKTQISCAVTVCTADQRRCFRYVKMVDSIIPMVLNPHLTNEFSHHSHLGESTFIFRGIKSDF